MGTLTHQSLLALFYKIFESIQEGHGFVPQHTLA